MQKRLLLCLFILVSATVTGEGTASAQSLTVNPGVMLGSGMERGATQTDSAVVASPFFADINLRAYTDEEDRIAWGGSVRIELNGLSNMALVPRAELRHALGRLELRPGVAFPIFVAPRTLLGPELSCALRVPLARGVGLQTLIFVTAYLAGSDLPANASLIQLGGALGVDLLL